jgi:hypothetical protein
MRPAMLKLFERFGAEARARRALQRQAPPLTVAELAEGRPARITGIIVALDTVEAPLSKRTCVYAEQRSELYATGSNRLVRELPRTSRGTPFLVDDGTGRVLVDPHHARVAMVFDHDSENLPEGQGTNTGFDRILERNSRGRVRHTEGVLQAGARIAVLGTCTRSTDPAAPLRLAAAAGAPLLISDAPDTIDRERF